MESKNCNKCNTIKPYSDFARCSNGKASSWCKICKNRIRSERLKDSTEEERRFSANRIFNLKLKSKYSINREIYDKILEEQNYCCSICKSANSYTKYNKLFVDHCHITNKVRGLLCHNCNAGLGQFKDNPIFLQSAIEYLK